MLRSMMLTDAEDVVGLCRDRDRAMHARFLGYLKGVAVPTGGCHRPNIEKNVHDFETDRPAVRTFLAVKRA